MQIARFALVSGLVLALSASAAEKKPAAAADKPTFSASKTSSITSKVKAVDQKTRMVTLANEDGEITFKAAPEVKNLKQVKVGDQVTVSMTESLTIHVPKPGEAVPSATEQTSGATAKEGDKPAAHTEHNVTVVAKIVAIDLPNMIVTLQGPKGDTYPVKAKDKAKVAKLAVGDDISIKASKALAIQVTTPAAAPAAAPAK